MMNRGARMKREVLRKTVSGFLSFVSALLALAAAVLLLITAVLSKPVVKTVMAWGGYADLAHGEIKERLESYAVPGGLPDDFFADGPDRELLKRDIDRAVESAYAGTAFTAEEFVLALTDRVEEYAADTGIDTENETAKTAVSQLMSHFETAYSTYVNSSAVRLFARGFNMIFPRGIVAGAVAAVLACALMWVVHRINPLDDEVYFSGFLGGTAFMLAFLPAAVLVSGRVAKLGITSGCTYAVVSGVLYMLLFSLLAAAVLFAAAAVIRTAVKRSRLKALSWQEE